MSGVSGGSGAGVQPRISMVTLGVKGLEKSVRFYERGPGFPRMDSPLGVAHFTLNGARPGLCGREALAQDAAASRRFAAKRYG